MIDSLKKTGRENIFNLNCMLIFLIIISHNSCSSFNKMTINMIADTISSGGQGDLFSSEEDSELARDAFPFILKFHESLINSSEPSSELFLSTGKAFIVYAALFVHSDASMIPSENYKKKNNELIRAKKLYLRGCGYLFQGFELKHPGFTEFTKKGNPDKILKKVGTDELPFLYWTAAGLLGAFSADTMDFDLSGQTKNAVKLLSRCISLDDGYNYGSAHELLTSYYGAMPEQMGGDKKKALFHFKKSLEYSEGFKISAYVAYASSISIKNQDRDEFTELLNKALAIDINEKKIFRLSNIISGRKAKWLLKNSKNFFLTE